MATRLHDLVLDTASWLRAHDWRLVTAESCTGGGIAAALTSVAGSSDWFDSGWVTYSNAAKTAQLDVAPELLAAHGAVSEAVVAAMVAGALRHSTAQAALAVSGIAGPGGGTADKPVGTVCFAWAVPGEAVRTETCHFNGDREAVRRAAVIHALAGLCRPDGTANSVP